MKSKCFVNYKEKFWGVGYPVSWAPCCETWLKEKSGVKDFHRSGKKMFGSWVTLLVGRHVVNESKVGCYVVNKLGIF